MAASRVVEPEWLDTLPPDNPRAIRSRRDLVRVNALMGNAAIVKRELAKLGRIDSIAEIGCGSGELLAKVLSRGGGRAFLVDLHPDVSPHTLAAFRSKDFHAQAVAADVFDWLADPATPGVDVVVANLFLHHFEASRLSALLQLASRKARAFIACEPRRSALALAGARMLGFAGCNDVTRHDAVVSVRAGFGDGEISALWSADGRWRLREGRRGLFSHGFTAVREAR